MTAFASLGAIIAPESFREVPPADNLLPYIGMENVATNSGRILGFGDSSVIKSPSPLVQTGDVLYGRLRPYLNKVTVSPVDAYVSGEFIVFRGNERVIAPYLRWVLASHEFVQFATALNSGDRPRVKWSQVQDFRLRLPPIGEQRQIVDVLEYHLSRLDAADAELTSAEQRLAILRDSLTSKFMSECDSEIALGAIASVGTGSTPSRSNPSYYLKGTMPWLTSGDLVQGGEARPTRMVTEDAVRDARLRVFPRGTLVMAMYGEGKTRGTVAELGVDSTMNQACAGIQVRGDEFDRAWVKLALVASYRRMRARASGGVQPNLNLAIVRTTGVPVASQELKMRAVREIHEVGEAAGRLSREIAVSRARSAALRRAVLTAALSGYLSGRASESDRIEELADASHNPR